MKRPIFASILILIISWFIIWLWLLQPKSSDFNKDRSAKTIDLPLQSSPFSPTQPSKQQQPGGTFEPREPRWKWWNEMKNKDPYFEWKMPIDFYGKVVDYDTNIPIKGVEVLLEWNDTSKEGTSRAIVLTDEVGVFKLVQKFGKILSVTELKKEGYIRSRVDTPSMFEYAAFFEKNYHQPDPDKPVIFRMKMKGEAEPLIHHQGEITVGIGRVSSIRLDRKTTIRIELLANEPMSAKNWEAEVTVPGGGIQVTTEEFPFTAPEKGYKPSLILDLHTPKPKNWTRIYQGGQFYIETANGQYGRIELKTLSGKTFMRYSVHLNPTPDSRNLEYDPEKRMIP